MRLNRTVEQNIEMGIHKEVDSHGSIVEATIQRGECELIGANIIGRASLTAI